MTTHSQTRAGSEDIVALSTTAAGVPVKYWVGAICPDQLQFRDIGEPDGLRGRFILLIFWLLQPWSPPRG